ncbi:unnamed protein product [Rotaria sordida]|uniref:Uncharacterized protein n=1 Tax=Rotaria sordida TaxID=392033 RepID=A0A819WBJ9_9BILA|nr:unnamed protein product [Rotaria sordida]
MKLLSIIISVVLVCCTVTFQSSNNNGFNFFAFNSTALALPDTLNSLKDIALIGSNWIGVNFIIAQDSNTSNQVYFDDRTPTFDVWSIFVYQAHQHNLRVLLKPLIVCGDECTFFNILPDNVTLWFSSYGEIIQNLSTIAQILNIDALSVGLELFHLSDKEYVSYWRSLIKNIRQGGYTGLLTYCSIFYPVETQQIQFWDILDFIGMDFYLPLLNITTQTIIPSYEHMIDRFSRYFQHFKQWIDSQPLNTSSKQVILTETGYPSSLGGLAAPFANLPSRCVGNYSANFTLQNMAFEAFFQAMKDNPGIINGSIIFWWENPSTRDFDRNENLSVWPCSWSPHGKPAECTIATAFGGKCPSSNDSRSTIFIHQNSNVAITIIIAILLTIISL